MGTGIHGRISHVEIPIVSYIAASGDCGTSAPEKKLNAWLTRDSLSKYILRVACFKDVHVLKYIEEDIA